MSFVSGVLGLMGALCPDLLALHPRGQSRHNVDMR
jgi:hypothetical protein